MPKQNAKFYFAYKPTENSYKVLKILKNKTNLFKLNDSLIFDFIIAYPDDSEFYRDEGIVGFPALVIQDEITIGAPAIIKILNKIISQYGTKKHNTDEALDEYLMKSVFAGVDVSHDGKLMPKNDDDDDNESDTLQKDLARALQDRKRRIPNFGEGMGNLPGARQIQEAHPNEQAEQDPINIHTPPLPRNRQPERAPTRAPASRLSNPITSAVPRNPTRAPRNVHGRKNNITPQSAIPIGKRYKSGGHATDDELMSNYFENLETTNI